MAGKETAFAMETAASIVTAASNKGYGAAHYFPTMDIWITLVLAGRRRRPSGLGRPSGRGRPGGRPWVEIQMK